MHFDTLKEAIEIEYVIKLYVESVVARDRQFTDLYDWQKERTDRFQAHARVTDYLLENVLFEKAKEFADAMNPVYLGDFKHVFYTVIFLLELLKNSHQKEQFYPATIDQIIQAAESIWNRQLRERLIREISRLPEVIKLIIDDYAENKKVLEDQGLENRDKIDHGIKDSKDKKQLKFYPLEDNLMFVLPFLAIKLLNYPMTCRAYIDLIVEHPRESMVNTTTEDYKELKDELRSKFLSFKLSLTPATLCTYQKRLLEFMFDDNVALQKSFTDLYSETNTQLIFPALFYLRLMSQTLKVFRIPKALHSIANQIFCALLAAFPEFISEKEEIACLGVCFFLLKAFYGLGFNAPSLATITKQQVISQVEDPEHRANLLSCLDFIAKFQTDCKLHEVSKNLPPFEMLLTEWFDLYRRLKRHNDEPCVMPQTSEDLANLTLQQMLSMIDSLGGSLLAGVKLAKLTIVDRPKSKDKVKRGPNFTKVEVSYPDRPGSYMLKDEVKQEMEFIMNCANNVEDLTQVELPHPSDVYVRYKSSGSIAVEEFTEDILIIFELFTVYVDQLKETVMPCLEKCESLILQLLQSTDNKHASKAN